MKYETKRTSHGRAVVTIVDLDIAEAAEAGMACIASSSTNEPPSNFLFFPPYPSASCFRGPAERTRFSVMDLKSREISESSAKEERNYVEIF